MGPEISSRHDPVGNLFLDIQITLSGLHVWRIVCNHIDKREWNPRRIPADSASIRKWEWISARIVLPREFQIHIGDSEARKVRRRGCQILILRMREIVKPSGRCANRCAAVAVDIPGKAQARRKVGPSTILTLFAVESGVTGEEHARRGGIKHSASDTF